MQQLFLVLVRVMNRLRCSFWAWHCREARPAGQGLVEYGLILVLIMVVCVGILTLAGHTVSQTWYDKIISAVP